MQERAIRKLIRLYGFWYGCIGSLGFLVWYVSAVVGHFVFPNNWWIVEGVFLLHGCAAVFTFQPQVRQVWRPVLSVTTRRVRLAKAVLTLSTLNFVLCFGRLMIAALRGNTLVADQTIPLVLTSFLLQNTTYIAIHWGVCPENIFSSGFIKTVSNPFGFLWAANKK
jgi:hypothetical protein